MKRFTTNLAEQPIRTLAAVQGVFQAGVVLTLAIVIALGGSVNAAVVAGVEGLFAAVFVFLALGIAQPRADDALHDWLVNNAGSMNPDGR